MHRSIIYWKHFSYLDSMSKQENEDNPRLFQEIHWKLFACFVDALHCAAMANLTVVSVPRFYAIFFH